MGLEKPNDNMRASKINVLGYMAWSCGPAQIVALPLAIAVSVQYFFIRFISAFEKDEKETPVPLKEKDIKVIKKENAQKPKNLELSGNEKEETAGEASVIKESISSPEVVPLNRKNSIDEEIIPKKPSRYKKMLEVCDKTESFLLYGLILPCVPIFGTWLGASISGRSFKRELVDLRDLSTGLHYIYKD